MLLMPMSRKDKGGSELLIYLGLFVTIFNDFSDCTEFTPSGTDLFESSVVGTPTNEVTLVQGRISTTKMGHGRLLLGRNVLISNTSSADGVDFSRKPSDDFQNIDADYQSDMGWDEPVPLKGQTHGIAKPEDADVEDLLLLEPEVECSRESMKLKIFDRSTTPGSLFFIDRGNEQAPLPLTQLPPSCGHTMKFTQINLVIFAPFDGCYVSLEENDYVLPLRWSGLPLKMSCPAPRQSMPSPPTVSCHSDGMVVNMGWTLSVQDIKVKFKEQWQLLMMVSSQCGFSVVTHPKGLAVSAPYVPCLETKDAMYTLELMGKGEIKASCPSQPVPYLDEPRDPNLSPNIPITSSQHKPVNPPRTLSPQHFPPVIASQIYPPQDYTSAPTPHTPHHPKVFPRPQTSSYQEKESPQHAVTRYPEIHTSDELVHKPFYPYPFYPWLPLPEIPQATKLTPGKAPQDPKVTRPLYPYTFAFVPAKSAGHPVPKFTPAVKHHQDINTKLHQPFYQHPFHTTLASKTYPVFQPTSPQPDATQFQTAKEPTHQPSNPDLLYPWWPTPQPQDTQSPKGQRQPFHHFTFYPTPQKTNPHFKPTASRPAVKHTPSNQTPVKVRPPFHPPSFYTPPSMPQTFPSWKPVPLELSTNAKKPHHPSQKSTPAVVKPPAIKSEKYPENNFTPQPAKPEPTVHPVHTYVFNPNDPRDPNLALATKPPKDHIHLPFYPNPFYSTQSRDPKPPTRPCQDLKPVTASPLPYPANTLPVAESFIPPVYCPQVCLFGFSNCCPVPISFHQHYHYIVPANVLPGNRQFYYPIFGYGPQPAFLPIQQNSNLNDESPAPESKDANSTTGNAYAAENFQSSSYNYWTKFASQLHAKPYDLKSVKPNFQHIGSSSDPNQLSESHILIHPQVQTLAENGQLFEPHVHHAGDLNKPLKFQIPGYPLYFPKNPSREPSDDLWPTDSSMQQHLSSQLEDELYPNEESHVLKPRASQPEHSTQKNKTETAGSFTELFEHHSTGSDAKENSKPDRNRHYMLQTFPSSNHHLGQIQPSELEPQPSIDVLSKLSKGQPLIQTFVPSLEPQPTQSEKPIFINARIAQPYNPPDYLNEDTTEHNLMKLRPTNLESFKHFWKPVFQAGSIERLSSYPGTPSHSQD